MGPIQRIALASMPTAPRLLRRHYIHTHPSSNFFPPLRTNRSSFTSTFTHHTPHAHAHVRRLVEAQVVKGLYSKLGLVPALTHIARLGDEAVVVDFLHAMSGFGFPRWPDCGDVSWVALVSPMLTRLMQSQFEECVAAGVLGAGKMTGAAGAADLSSALPSERASHTCCTWPGCLSGSVSAKRSPVN